MFKFKKVKTKVPKLSNDQRIIAIFAIILITLLTFAGSSVYIFRKSRGEKLITVSKIDKKSILDNTNVVNEDITISSIGVEPSTISLVVSKDYNLRIIKQPAVICQALKSEDLNITIVLNKTATEFPLTIPVAGEYLFRCVDQKATTLNFIVK